MKFAYVRIAPTLDGEVEVEERLIEPPIKSEKELSMQNDLSCKHYITLRVMMIREGGGLKV